MFAKAVAPPAREIATETAPRDSGIATVTATRANATSKSSVTASLALVTTMTAVVTPIASRVRETTTNTVAATAMVAVAVVDPVAVDTILDRAIPEKMLGSLITSICPPFRLIRRLPGKTFILAPESRNASSAP